MGIEFYAVKALMQSKDLQQIIQGMYNYRFEGNTWKYKLQWGRSKLLELGLECYEHSTLPYTVVAFMKGTRLKRPPCIVIGVSSNNVDIPSAIYRYSGNGLIQLIPKGVIDVTMERPC